MKSHTSIFIWLLALIMVISIIMTLPVSVSAEEIDAADSGAPSFNKILEQYPDLDKLTDRNYYLPNLKSIETISLVDGQEVHDTCNTMTPQGICTTEDYIIVSAYCGIEKYKTDLSDPEYKDLSGNSARLQAEENHKIHNSMLFVYDKDYKSLSCTISLEDSPHAGGVAYDGEHVWVCKSSQKGQNYIEGISISRIDNAVSGGASAYLAYDVKMECPCIASFATFFEGSLWVGVFDEKNSGSLNEYEIAKNSGGYELNNKRKITIPPMVNGADFVRAGGKLNLALNISHGRNNDTETRIYQVNESSSGSLSLSGTYTSYTLPPMGEEICVDNGCVYTLFESSSTVYSTVTGAQCSTPVDRICMGSVINWFGFPPDYGVTGELTWRLNGTELIISGNGRMEEYDYSDPAPWGYGITKVTFQGEIEKVSDYAFYNCKKLKSVKLPDSLTCFGVNAFSECSSLLGITIPDKVNYFQNHAFENCTGLKYLVLPESVDRIEGGTFKGCSGLESVVILSSDWGDYEDTFNGCTNLKSIILSDSSSAASTRAFYNCSSLESITIPDTVTDIHHAAFDGCSSLTSVTIPDSVTYIEAYAFYNCTSLKSVTIPDSVTQIDDRALGLYYLDIEGPGGYIYWDNKVPGFTIYGSKGSAAEDYADKNGLAFIEVTAKKDQSTGVTVDIPNDTSVNVRKTTGSAAASAAMAKLTAGSQEIASYDISLKKGGTVVQPETLVQVKIPCAKTNAKAFRIEADGSLTDMKASYKDGCSVFWTDHFGDYLLAEVNEVTADVSGSITSFLDEGEYANVILKGADNDFFGAATETDAYDIDNAPVGEYVLSVIKTNHVTREYPITISGDTTQDVRICPIGDIDGDGEVSGTDAMLAYRKARGKSVDLDEYALKCAEVDGEDGISGTDVMLIYRQARGKNSLF